jgi:hypothetical protein
VAVGHLPDVENLDLQDLGAAHMGDPGPDLRERSLRLVVPLDLQTGATLGIDECVEGVDVV